MRAIWALAIFGLLLLLLLAAVGARPSGLSEANGLGARLAGCSRARAPAVSCVSAMAPVDDVTALKLAHAAMEDMSTTTMRRLLAGLLTATAADKPACFVAVRVARAIVNETRDRPRDQPEPGTRSPEKQAGPVPRLDLRRHQDSRKADGAHPAVSLVSAEMSPRSATAWTWPRQRPAAPRPVVASAAEVPAAVAATVAKALPAALRAGGICQSPARELPKPVEHELAQQRERAKKQREHAALVAQRLARVGASAARSGAELRLRG